MTSIAANTDPIYSKLSDVQGGSLLITTAASVVYDISGNIGTDVYKVFTADSTNGGFVQRLRFKYAGNSTTASNGCVAKIWISSVGSGLTIATNAWLYDELALPTTGTLTTTATNATYDLPLNFALPLSWCIYVKITVSQPASFGWMCTTIAGKY